MDTAGANRVVGTCAALTFALGAGNTVIKNKELPSRQFLVGSAIVFIGLSALAQFEPDLAVPIAIAILTTVLLGEGGGVLSYFTPRNEIDTKKKPPAPTSQNPATKTPSQPPQVQNRVTFPTGIVIPGLVQGGQNFPPVTDTPVDSES